MACQEAEDEAARLKQKAEELRQQIRNMEASLGNERRNRQPAPTPTQSAVGVQADENVSLQGKRVVLVVGANGRLGSMVCRHLLRNNPNTEVVACVHVVGENSSRGYGRLSYEVGAEDGVGSIGAAWSEERTATFTYSDEMKDYNLQNLRVVEAELLDPLQCATITEGVDCVIWCATDFNGNRPRAVSGLNVAFLFRAVADPLKGRVEIEGLRNILGGLKQNKRDASGALDAVLGKTSLSSTSSFSKNDPVDVVLVSAAPEAFQDFETPFGTFNGLKREGEELLKNEFPSLSYSILQMSKYEDNFVQESLDILTEESSDSNSEDAVRRRINRRDAARAAVDALTNKEGKGKTLQVWTAIR
eukprot:CAMPEP_0202492274 /NCGR_PEP_ID=MMETSP1361-20130828/9049_1 /ASSEMBLY_ACC=CAM_ASM_000849 /TAXON_ID=210615 /ORGANISM="Staurosira complex sp., Strain CCMP2646" /LENGTH=359 /DNA_ID=CAMNT_0049122459 /DNA_START=129 /DNA_END=1208 /DNA_ORIENTATION=+